MLPNLSWTLYTVLNFLHLGNSIGWLDTVGPDWLTNAEELTPKGQIDILSSLLYTGQSEILSLSLFIYLFISLGVYLAISVMYFSGALSKLI